MNRFCFVRWGSIPPCLNYFPLLPFFTLGKVVRRASLLQIGSLKKKDRSLSAERGTYAPDYNAAHTTGLGMAALKSHLIGVPTKRLI